MAKFKAGAIADILKEFDVKTQAKAEKGLRIAIVGTWGAIIKQTPVDTGRARGNWFITYGKPSSKTGRANKNKGENYVNNNLKKLFGGQKVFLTNNLPYIKSLEYGVHEAANVGAHSRSAHTRKQNGKSIAIGAHSVGPYKRGKYNTTAYRMVRDNVKTFERRLKAAFKGLK